MNSRFNSNKAVDKISGFISRKAKILIAVLAVAIIGVTAFAIYTHVKNANKVAGLESVSIIQNDLYEGYSTLSKEDQAARREQAISQLGEYTSKSAVVGVRANMLAAEISLMGDDQAAAASYYAQACDKDSSSYTYGLCAFNAAVCYENAGESEKALEYYSKSANDSNSILKSHAKFSVGRLYESQNKIEDAVNAYSSLYNDMVENVTDEWVLLAKSRLLALGK